MKDRAIFCRFCIRNALGTGRSAAASPSDNQRQSLQRRMAAAATTTTVGAWDADDDTDVDGRKIS